MVRGVAAVPQQILAPRQGKWWNENEGHWVLTKMEEEAKILEDVPEDDSDLLGKIQDNLDASFKPSKGAAAGTEVVDMYYYETLEVTSDADQATLKRRYYQLARQYHPDKVGTDDKESADKFKDIAEAYQVLSDPELREKYNKDGRDGLSADKTSAAGGMGKMDSDMLFAFLFGSDLFYDYVGRLATATSASIGDSPEVSVQDARKLQKRRVTRLALNLITKTSPWISQVHAGAADGGALEDGWKDEAIELSKASFGFELVTTIGKAYTLVAIMFEGSNEGGQGLPNVSKWAAAQKANMDTKNAANKNKMETMKASIDMMKVQMKLKQKLADATTDEEKEQINIELQEASVGILLRVLWTTTVVDITSTIYETCQMLFYDQSVDKETRKLRAKAIKALGKIWTETPDPDGGTKTKDAKELYEEAAFAAMLETVKRKDAATHGQMARSEH
jgi:curved DNA-binding protein CbpA